MKEVFAPVLPGRSVRKRVSCRVAMLQGQAFVDSQAFGRVLLLWSSARVPVLFLLSGCICVCLFQGFVRGVDGVLPRASVLRWLVLLCGRLNSRLRTLLHVCQARPGDPNTRFPASANLAQHQQPYGVDDRTVKQQTFWNSPRYLFHDGEEEARADGAHEEP